MSAPAISIIMPCYNALLYLPSSVDSVLAQTSSDWELITVDDGSIDDTPAWLRAQKDPRLRVHTQTNQGVSAARNNGLKLARGRYVAFLDADDTWAPTFLEKMSAALEARPDAVMTYCGWQNVGVPGPKGLPFIPPDYESPAKLETLFAGCRWPIHAALGKLQAVLAVGGFNPQLKNAEDYALWLEVAGNSTIVRVPEVLAYYNFHGDSQASSNRARSALSLLDAQQSYLARHPDFSARLGRNRRRELLYGNLLKQGYENYWKRNLPAARAIFRRVMRNGYGHPKDWAYMLPALTPLPIHKLLISILESKDEPDSSSHNTTNQP